MSSSPSKLFTPLQLGSIGALRHRVVLAPLTRNRATEPELAPSETAVQYYRQRASPGGLLITEAVHISPESLAYPSTPGIWSTTQVEAWRRVTQAVHERGGLIVCQLWHTGRVAHPDFAKHPSNVGERHRPGVSASQVQIVSRSGKPGKTLTYDGIRDFAVPRELSVEDLQRLIDDYTLAAQNAKAAGFDGVEIHAAHGYLIDQFLNNGVNRRTDQYGGSCENRCRLLRQVVEAVSGVWADGKVGVRLSPHDAPNGGNVFYGCTDSNPDAIYSHAVQALNEYPLAYLLVTEPRWVGKHDANPEKDPGFQMPLINLQKYRSLFHGVMIGAGGFTPASSYEACMEDRQGYDAIAFGRWFISNPDLPARLKAWHQSKSSRDRQEPTRDPPWLNRYDRNTFYASGAEGYIDYPSMEYEGAALSSNATTSIEHEGMIAGKYQLMDPSKVGTSLTATENTEARSKL